MDSLKWVSGHKTLSLHFHVFPQVPFLASGRQNSVMLCSSTKQACECTAKCIFSAAKGVWKAICWSVCAAEAVWMQHLSLCQLFFSLLMGYDHSGLWKKKKKEQLHLINVFLKTKVFFDLEQRANVYSGLMKVRRDTRMIIHPLFRPSSFPKACAEIWMKNFQCALPVAQNKCAKGGWFWWGEKVVKAR